MGPSEIVITGGVLMIVIKELIALIKSLIPTTPVLTEKDMKQMEYQTAMNGLVSDVKNILIKLSDRQEQTKDAVKDIEHIQGNTHKRIGSIDSSLDVLKQVITKDSIKESVRDGLKHLNLAS